jgi:hypothetical protein
MILWLAKITCLSIEEGQGLALAKYNHLVTHSKTKQFFEELDADGF